MVIGQHFDQRRFYLACRTGGGFFRGRTNLFAGELCLGFCVGSDELIQLLAPRGAMAIPDEAGCVAVCVQALYCDDDEFHGQ